MRTPSPLNTSQRHKLTSAQKTTSTGKNFQADWSAHNHLCLKWVQQALVKRRFGGHVSEELKEYYTSRKMHRHIAPTYLSDQTKSAVKSCEQEVETDIEWARRASRGLGEVDVP